MRRYKYFLYGLLAFLIGFNLWHVSKHGLWSPPTFVDSLSLSQECARQYSQFDHSIRPSINGHYDGQWFYMLAYDPFVLNRSFQGSLELSRYRHNRVFYSLLTHFVGLGRPKLYPYVLFLVAFFSYLAGAGIVYRICELQKWTKWVVIGYLVNTGLLYSAFRDMSEPLGVTLTLLGLVNWLQHKRNFSICAFALAALTKEIYIIAPCSLYFWVWWKENGSARRVGFIALLTVGPLIAWMLYVSLRIPNGSTFSAVPMACPSFGIGKFSLPFVALTQETLFGLYHATTRTVLKLTLSMSIITVMLILVSFIGVVRRPTLWSFLLASQGLFLSCTRGEIWNYFASSCRQTSLLYIFAFFWIADELKYINQTSSVTIPL